MLTRRVLALGFCVFALSATSAFAADGASAGVVIGANIASAKLTGSDATGVDVGRKTGLLVGGFALWPITDAIGIQPEVTYSQKHFTVKDSLSGFTATEKWDWIEVPVLARISLWQGGTHRIYAVAGPEFGFRARAKEESGGQTSDIKDDVRSSDVSLVGGGGLAMGKVGVEVRYDGGLRDLNKDHNLGDNLTVKSRAVTIDLTWAFR